MPRKYPPDFKAEVVATAVVTGAESAASTYSVDVRTVRTWLAEAGHKPSLDVPRDRWAELADIAITRVQTALLGGKVRPKDAAVIAAIAGRNARKAEVASPESAVAVQDAFYDWLAERVRPEVTDEQTLEAVLEAIGDVHGPMLLRRANAERPDGMETTPHRSALLAWHSGREEIPADDVLQWAMAQVEDAIATHGSLIGWHAWQEERDAEDHRRYEEQLERNRINSQQAIASSRQAMLDAETRSLLAAAEAFLRQTPQEDLR